MMPLAAFRKKLASRKGAAMEMAIMVIVVTFSLSILILTTSLLQHSRQLRAKEKMAQSIVLEQISEDFCADAGVQSRAWIAKYPDYDITINGHMLSVTKKDSDNVLLVVALSYDGSQYTVSRWNKK